MVLKSLDGISALEFIKRPVPDLIKLPAMHELPQSFFLVHHRKVLKPGHSSNPLLIASQQARGLASVLIGKDANAT
jgi:hypothetical protein